MSVCKFGPFHWHCTVIYPNPQKQSSHLSHSYPSTASCPSHMQSDAESLQSLLLPLAFKLHIFFALCLLSFTLCFLSFTLCLLHLQNILAEFSFRYPHANDMS